MKQALENATFRTAQQIIREMGAYRFIKKNTDGHSVFRNSARPLPEDDIVRMFVKHLELEVNVWHRK